MRTLSISRGHDDPAEEHGGDHGADHADAQGDREAADLLRADIGQHEADDQVGHIAVDDGGQGLLVAQPHAGAEIDALAEFLADALVDQHIGVHRHAEGEDDAGDAGQGQRGAGQGEGPDDHRAVGQRSADDGDRAVAEVVEDHEPADDHERDQAGVEATAEVVRTQLGAMVDSEIGSGLSLACSEPAVITRMM
jgi:hypothetical protein